MYFAKSSSNLLSRFSTNFEHIGCFFHILLIILELLQKFRILLLDSVVYFLFVCLFVFCLLSRVVVKGWLVFAVVCDQGNLKQKKGETIYVSSILFFFFQNLIVLYFFSFEIIIGKDQLFMWFEDNNNEPKSLMSNFFFNQCSPFYV